MNLFADENCIRCGLPLLTDEVDDDYETHFCMHCKDEGDIDIELVLPVRENVFVRHSRFAGEDHVAYERSRDLLRP